MKGLMIVFSLLCIWIGSALYTDYQRQSLPFKLMEEDTSIKSGYNDIHIFRENNQITKLEVFDQTRERVKVYQIDDLKDLYPSASYVKGEVKEGKLYLLYDEGGKVVSKRVVVGARGSLSFMPERK